MMVSYQFESLQQLFWMNGHGPYVWSAYGICLLAMGFLIVSPLIRRRHFLRNLQAAVRREQLQRQGTAGGGSVSQEAPARADLQPSER